MVLKIILYNIVVLKNQSTVELYFHLVKLFLEICVHLTNRASIFSEVIPASLA